MALFDGLEIFVTVVDCGSFTGAAARLGLSKSFVSESVKALETRLGVRLLDRTTRALRPTEAGLAFHGRATRALAEAASARDEAQQHQADAVGRLRVAVFEGFHRTGLVEGLGAFLDAHPSLQLELVEGVPAINLIDEGIDLAIRVTPSPDPGLVVRRLGVSRVVLLAAPQYLDRAGTPATPGDLAAHRVLAFAPLYLAREWRFIIGGRPLSFPVRPALLANTSESLRIAAVAGQGIVALPRWCVGDLLASGALVQLLADYQLPEAGIYAVYASNRLMAPKVKLFVDHLLANLPASMRG